MYLEDLLSLGGESTPAAPAGRSVVRLWDELQLLRSIGGVRDALRLLSQTRYALHIEEQHVRLLLSAASGKESWKECAEELGSIRASAALVISVWVRRSSRLSRNAGTPQLVAATYCEFLQAQPALSNLYACESILLLGSLCTVQESSLCQSALVEEITIRRDVIIKSRSLPAALAGIGYAVTGSRGSVLRSIVGALVLLWTPAYNLDGTLGCRPALNEGLMVLRLFEFLGSWLSSLDQAKLRDVDGVWDELLRGTSFGSSEVKAVKVMASAGLLRGTPPKRKTAEFWRPVNESLEALITDAASDLCQELQEQPSGGQKQTAIPETTLHQLRCLSLAAASCKGFPSNEALQTCLSQTLLEDVLNLSSFYSLALHRPAGLQKALEQLKTRVEGVIFKEAGTIARALCDQYRNICVSCQQQLEGTFWRYSLDLYGRHRVLALENPDGYSIFQNKELSKILEAVFLSMVLFYSTLLQIPNRPCELAAYALDSFSCVEHLRRFNLPEYSEIIKQSVALVAHSREASSKLAGLIPSSEDLILCPGASNYSWSQDEVQTSRVLFYFRVLPSCLEKLDESIFENRVAPVMFLYMCHSSKQTTEAAHSLFASFVSRQAEAVWNEGGSLAEQLAVYYINETLKSYPEVVTLEGLIYGVRAIAEHLPAGSAAAVYCVASLVNRAIALSGKEDEAAHKLQTLLLHLIFLVDTKVLPHLLKGLARLVTSLPSLEQKQRAVREALALVEKSDDCLRKPIVVPWLQSLAYVATGPAHSRL